MKKLMIFFLILSLPILTKAMDPNKQRKIEIEKYNANQARLKAAAEARQAAQRLEQARIAAQHKAFLERSRTQIRNSSMFSKH